MPHKDPDRAREYRREYTQRIKSRRRKPCRRCGGAKGDGEWKWYCELCEADPPEPPTCICDWCKASFAVKYAHNPNRFCSLECKNAWQRANWGNPFKTPRIKASRWGISKKPGPCRSCGAKAVNLHHAIPRSKSRYLSDDLRNGLPLCARCHSRWHHGYPIRREVFTAEEWECLTTAHIPGWVTEAWLDKHYPSAENIAERALVVA